MLKLLTFLGYAMSKKNYNGFLKIIVSHLSCSKDFFKFCFYKSSASVVSGNVLARDPWFAGSKPTEVDGFFRT